MAIEFQCPECKAAVRVPDIHAGKKACCPGCKQKIRIPALEKSTEAPKAVAAELPDSAAKVAGTAVETKPESVTPSSPLAPVAVTSAVEALKASDAAAPAAASPAPAVPTAAAPAAPSATPPVTPGAAPAGTASGKSAYVKFACPSCGKMTGFEAKFAGTALPCPSCKVKVMVPELSDGESFIVGSVPGNGSRKPSDGAHAAHAGHSTHSSHASAHRPSKKKPGSSGFPVLGALAGTAGIALIITAAVYWPRKIPGTAGEHATTPKSPPVASAPASAMVPALLTANNAAATTLADKTPADVTPKTSSARATDEQVAEAKAGDNDTMEIGARPDAPPATQVKLPETVSDILSTKDKKNARPEEENSGNKADTSAGKPDVSSDVMKELVKPVPVEETPKPAETAHKNTPPTPSAPPTKPANAQPKPLNPTAPAAVAAAGPAVCPQCLGMGTVPILGARPYLRAPIEPLNAATAAAAVPWKLCSKCQAATDPQTLISAETARLSGVAAINEHWEQLTRAKLTALETHHLTIRSTMPEPEVRNVATALEQLTLQLEQLTQTTVLSQTRPDTDELMIGWDVQGYMAFVTALMQIDPNHDWSLAQTSGGCLLPHKGIFNANRGIGVNPKHMSVYQYGELILMQATDNKAPTWLRYGFASYCENLITHKNLVYAFQYEKNEVRFSDNWDNEIRKYAGQGKLKTWDQAFLIQPIGMTSLDYLTCYSMVSFMMNTDPKLFPRYCLAMKSGLDSEKAFEQVYKTDVKKLQSMWSTWAQTLRN